MLQLHIYNPFTVQDDADGLTCYQVSVYYLFQGKPDLIPSILTLTLNDALTYDKVGQKMNLSCEY